MIVTWKLGRRVNQWIKDPQFCFSVTRQKWNKACLNILLNFLGSELRSTPMAVPLGFWQFGEDVAKRGPISMLRLGRPMIWKWVYIWLNSNTLPPQTPLSSKTEPKAQFRGSIQSFNSIYEHLMNKYYDCCLWVRTWILKANYTPNFTTIWR